jgi:hypothetical protein
MLRKVVLFSVFLLLIGCGGSDSGGDNSGGGTGTNPADPLQQYLNIANQYTGIKTAASLDRDSVSRFMQAFASLQAEILPSYDDQQAHSAELCTKGGSAVFTPKSGNTEFDVRFNFCTDGSATLNGDATFRVTKRDASGNVTDGLTIYRDTSLRYNSSEYVLRGNIRHKDLSTSSCPIEQNISNLLLIEQGSGEQWYFENFYDHRFGTFGISCIKEGIQFSGRVYISELGFVTVTTPELLMLPSLVTSFNNQGRLEFAGANAQLFSWRIRNSRTIYETLFTHDFSLNGDSGFSYQYRSSILTDAMMLDFRDTDADGMPDSWERFYGLDPLNAADAVLDMDGDGYSNLDELNYVGDPSDITILPSIYQLAVSLKQAVAVARHSELVVVYTDITHSSDAHAYNSELHYKTESPFMFSESGNCGLSENRLEAVCKIEKIEANTRYEHIIFVEAPATLLNEISAPLTVSLYTPGRNISTQTEASMTVLRQEADFSFNLSQPYPGKGSLLAVVGEQNYMLLHLSQRGIFYDFVPGMKINVVIPQELGDSSAFCRQYGEWQPCTDYNIVNSSTRTEINIAFSANHSGTGSGKIEVLAPENVNPLATWSFQIISGQPTSLLQQAIDSSTEGHIVVPADIYVGGLDLSTKKITLVGENQETYLIGKVNEEDNSSRQIMLDKGSEITGFSLANLEIRSGNDGGALTSNRMAIPELLQQGNIILANGSLTLRKNKFSSAALHHPFSEIGTLNTCSYISLQQNDADSLYSFVFENNLMMNDGMQASYCSLISIADGYESRVEHNTISDVYNFLAINAYSDAKPSTLLVRNNAFINLGDVVSVVSWGAPALQIDVINNLFEDVERPVALADIPYTLSGNIVAEAGLDAAGNPLKGAAVIDAATVSDITEDVFGNPRPVDGNNDGNDLPDIGAVERQN